VTEPGGADYSTVTEVTGNRLTREAISMMFTRYQFGASLSRGLDVLEVACGAGQGLGLLAASARKVVAGDFTGSLVERARKHYHERIPVLQLDAQVLPFKDGSFDVVLLYEAVYYLRDVGSFLREAKRILRPQGRLILCSSNPEWSEFNPSPYSVRYYPAEEFAGLLRKEGFEARLLGAYPSGSRGGLRKAVSWLRRVAVALHLMPKTMKGKEFLKRLFYGSLVEMPAELNGSGDAAPAPAPVAAGEFRGQYKVYFAVGTRP